MSKAKQEARAGWLSESLSFDALKSYLELDHGEHIYVLMSERRMPGALVGRQWRFHPVEIDDWLAAIGGRQAVAVHIADWERREAASLRR